MLKDYSELQERYLSDSLPIRIGNLAATINRIALRMNANFSSEKVLRLVLEGQEFIEWTASSLEPERAEELVQGLQMTLAGWKLHWDSIWISDLERQNVQIQARAWAEKLLGWMEDMQARAEPTIQPRD